MRRLPPVGSMQAFVEVARQGSLKAAADQLALSSPALTRRIQSLEQFVGVSLFERQHNGIQLNPRGAAFYAEIAPHIDAMAQAVERMQDPAREMRLRVAVPSLFASQRLMPALSSLRAEHPTMIVEVDTGPNRMARLGDDLDAVIAIASAIDVKHYSRLLERGTVVAIGSRELIDGRGNAFEAADLQGMPILLHRDMPEAFDHWRRAAGLAQLNVGSVIRYDAGQLVLDAAAGGMGVAFMHESHIRHSSDPRLVQLFERKVTSPYSYWFVCTPEALERRPVRLFHDWLFAWFAGNQDGFEGDGADAARVAQHA